MCRCGGTDPLEFRGTRSDPAGRFHSACRVFRPDQSDRRIRPAGGMYPCKYWNDMGHPEYKVNVNLSVVQLLQNDHIVERIRACDQRRRGCDRAESDSGGDGESC